GLAQLAVGRHRERLDPVPVVHVELLLVRREAQPVGLVEGVRRCGQPYLARGADREQAEEVKLPAPVDTDGVVPPAVVGIGEVDGAVRAGHHVVGTVEVATLVVVRDDLPVAVAHHPYHTAGHGFTEQQVARPVEDHAVGNEVRPRNQLRAGLLPPPPPAVVLDVVEQPRLGGRIPHRSFGEDEAAGELPELCARVDQVVDLWFGRHDPHHRVIIAAKLGDISESSRLTRIRYLLVIKCRKIQIMASSAEAKRTRAEYIRDRMRDDILNGVVKPGQRLMFPDLVERYGASVGVTREALAGLVSQGLVRSIPHHGHTVTPISAEDLQDLVEARSMVEPLVLKMSVSKGGIEWEANLMATFHRMSRTKHLLPEDPSRPNPEWAAIHEEFHQALFAACGNR